MWRDLFVEVARERREVFKNLGKYLAKIAEVVKELDPGAEVYLFGSVAEGRHVVASDIDVLVVTRERPEVVLDALWRAGIRDPFEVHVIKPEELPRYRRYSVLRRVI